LHSSGKSRDLPDECKGTKLRVVNKKVFRLIPFVA